MSLHEIKSKKNNTSIHRVLPYSIADGDTFFDILFNPIHLVRHTIILPNCTQIEKLQIVI